MQSLNHDLFYLQSVFDIEIYRASIFDIEIYRARFKVQSRSNNLNFDCRHRGTPLLIMFNFNPSTDR